MSTITLAGPNGVFVDVDIDDGIPPKAEIDPPDEDVPDLSELPADVPEQEIVEPEEDAQVPHEAPVEEPQ